MSSLPTQGRVMVTGASSGIGAAYAENLAKQGYSLCLVARRQDRLDALAQTLRSAFGADVEVLVADLESADGLADLELRLARDDVVGLINNAGAGGLGPIAAAGPQALERNLRLNIIALARLSRAALTEFKRRDAGFLVNIGSVLAFAPSPAAAAYSGSKAFVLNFTRSLQLEFSASAIRIQLVMPCRFSGWQLASQDREGSWGSCGRELVTHEARIRGTRIAKIVFTETSLGNNDPEEGRKASHFYCGCLKVFVHRV